MSGQQRNNQNNQGSNILKTAAVFAGGAIAGAVLAYFASEAVQETPNRQANVPHQNRTEDNEKDEKTDGVIQLCEICFLPFEEIKAGGGQIVATPCGHVFCKRCIVQSLGHREDCPNCRSPVTVADLQRLFL